MPGRKVIAICQLGGVFKTLSDGSLWYEGGNAHAIDIDENSTYNDFQIEVAEMFNCIGSSISIKYFLPRNRRTLITISNDKDLQRMIKFHGNSSSIDVYIMIEEVVAPDVLTMPASSIMKVVAAYLLALLGGNASPTAEDLKNIFGSVGATADEDRIELLLSEVKGKDTTELIAAGREKRVSVPSGGVDVAVAAAAGRAAPAASAAAEPKKEEKVEEKGESDDDMGFYLFD